MAEHHDIEEVRQALLDRMHDLATSSPSSANNTYLLQVAEAYAWVTAPSQPHGSAAGKTS